MTNRYNIKRFAKTRQEFEHYYQEELADKIVALEAERSKAMKPMKYFGVGGLMVLMPILVYALMTEFPFILGLIVLALAFTFYMWLTNSLLKPIEKRVKEEVVRELVHFLNPNYTYEPTEYIPLETFLYADLFKRDADEYTGDDLVTGYVEDLENGYRTDLSFSEVQATEVTYTTDQNGHRRKQEHVYIKGFMFIVDFHKSFGHSTTKVLPSKQRVFKKLGKRFESVFKRDLNPIDIEHPAFSNQFDVWSDDEVQSRVILQLDFIEKLMSFVNGSMDTTDTKTSYPKSTPYFSFKDGKMFFLLHTQQDHFAISATKPIDQESVYIFFQDINRSLELIDELNINLRIYDTQ